MLKIRGLRMETIGKIAIMTQTNTSSEYSLSDKWSEHRTTQGIQQMKRENIWIAMCTATDFEVLCLDTKSFISCCEFFINFITLVFIVKRTKMIKIFQKPMIPDTNWTIWLPADWFVIGKQKVFGKPWSSKYIWEVRATAQMHTNTQMPPMHLETNCASLNLMYRGLETARSLDRAIRQSKTGDNRK